jgi:exonuclease SbcC
LKLLSLRLKNINSFKDELHLDFTKEPLSDASLFAITGPTGSGKTTLLDAISVALYNRTPRLDGTGSSNPVNLLSQGTREGFSEVVFQANDTQYLAEWRARRSKKGDVKPEVKLLRADTGELITSRRKGKSGSDMADMSVEDAVTSILGIDFNAFRRSILLAQGDFAAFLKASADERRQILEATTGMGEFEVLKENLNQQVRKVTGEYDIAGAGLEKMPEASAEEIGMAEKELARLEAELLSLNEPRTALEKEKENEQRRVDAHNKLDDARKRQQELLSMKDDMESLKLEIERAQKASDIRPEMGSYHTEKERVEKLETALEGSIQDKKAGQKRSDEAKAKYDASNLEFETARNGAKQKKKAFDEATALETSGKGQIGEADIKQKEADDLKVKLDKLDSQIQQKNKEITALEEELKGDREFLEHNPLPGNADDLLARASQTAASLTEKERTLGEKQEALVREKDEHLAKTEEMEGIVDEGKVIETRKNDITSRLEAAGQALQPLTEEGDGSYWRTLASAWGEVRDASSRFLESYGQLSGIFDDTILTASVQDFNENLHEFKHRTELLDQQVMTAGEKVKRCQAEEKAVAAANQALILRRGHLTADEPCPVCGSTEHPNAGKHEPDREGSIDGARENVQSAEAGLDTAKHDLESAFRELSKLAKKKVNACDKQMDKIESLSKQIDSTESELKLAGQQIEASNTRIDALSDQIEGIAQKILDISAKIMEMEDDISDNNKQFFSIIPAEFAGEPPQLAFEKFKQHISKTRDSIGRLEQNNTTLVELGTFVQENTRRLDEDTTRYSNLLENAAEYRDKGTGSLEQVMEMTGGKGVEAARSALEAQLIKKENNRDTMLEDSRQAETQLAAITARLEGQRTELGKTQEVMATAKSVYLQALENAGFESVEEHKASFRDPGWMDEKRQALQQYNNDWHTVEENIRTHAAVFAQTPFNPDDLKHILDRERELLASIEEKNTLKGGLKGKIKTLNENFTKRQEQEKKLEGARAEMERWQKLAAVIPANSLRDFALQSMFDLLITIANRQLSDITSRYALRAVDLKDMVVIDLWNAGEERPVETLSGGESFLVSLSLALALSELSSGRSRLESLFLDEGFGTLDSETLDAALNALESLRLSGRTIGVISHIEQLTRRIPVRIDVKRTGVGTSTIHVKG